MPLHRSCLKDLRWINRSRPELKAKKRSSHICPFYHTDRFVVFDSFHGTDYQKLLQKIALLRTLGFSSMEVSGIFVRYSLILTLTSTLLDGELGTVLLSQMLNIYRSVYDLPFILFRETDGRL